MNKVYGYDRKTRHLFSWEDSDPHYEGVVTETDLPDDFDGGGEELPEWRAALSACYFLSGASKTECITIFQSNKNQTSWVSFRDGDIIRHFPAKLSENSSVPIPVCLCGPDVDDPQIVGDVSRDLFLRNYHIRYVCHLTEELVAFGRLAMRTTDRWKSPRRLSLAEFVMDPIEGKVIQDFDEKLSGDAAGNLGVCIGWRGLSAINELRRQPGISPFFGKVLSKEMISSADCYIVTADAVDDYFPTEVPTARNYAASCVPTRLKCNDRFREDTGYDGDMATVFVATDYVPDIVTFMNAYCLKSGKMVVGSFSKNCLDRNGKSIVFRYNKAYEATGTTTPHPQG